MLALLLLPLLNSVVPQRKVLVADGAAPLLSNWFLMSRPVHLNELAAPSASSSGAAPAAPGTSDGAVTRWPRTWSATWPQLVVLAWAIGVLVCSARVVYGLPTLRRLRHNSVVLDSGPLWEQMQEALHALDRAAQ
jgi:hypothetical protein